jgi:hypothetical protein
LEKTPETLFLTITRRSCGMLNSWAVESLYAGQQPLDIVPGDPESNAANYRGSTLVGEVPMTMPIYLGMRVILTKNLKKKIGFVNGMGAVVLGMTQRGNVRVRTEEGRPITIYPWTAESGIAHFPFRLGYASTLHKVQGATLAHITLWLDVKNCPAAGYVALSRVEFDKNWQFIGDPCVHHFTPVNWK